MEDRADLGRTLMYIVSLLGKLSHISALLILEGLGGWEQTVDISFAIVIVVVVRRAHVSIFVYMITAIIFPSSFEWNSNLIGLAGSEIFY